MSEDIGTRDPQPDQPFSASQETSQPSAAVLQRTGSSGHGAKAAQHMAAPVFLRTSDGSVDTIGDVQRPQDSVTSAMSARLQKRSSVPGWDCPEANRGHDDSPWPPGNMDQSAKSRASLVCYPALVVPYTLTQFSDQFMSSQHDQAAFVSS